MIQEWQVGPDVIEPEGETPQIISTGSRGEGSLGCAARTMMRVYRESISRERQYSESIRPRTIGSDLLQEIIEIGSISKY